MVKGGRPRPKPRQPHEGKYSKWKKGKTSSLKKMWEKRRAS